MEYVTLTPLPVHWRGEYNYALFHLERPLSNGVRWIVFHHRGDGRLAVCGSDIKDDKIPDDEYFGFSGEPLRGARGLVYLALWRLAEPVLLSELPSRLTHPQRLTLLDDEQKLLDTLRRGW